MPFLVWLLVVFLCGGTSVGVSAAPPALGEQAPETFNLTGATIQPLFSPDNSLDLFVKLINSANTTLDITNQYIKHFCGNTWEDDCNPIMATIIAARVRGVAVRVMLSDGGDSDGAAAYLASMGATVCYLTSNLYNHNKGVIVDQSVVAVSSINWSKQALTKNREAGAIVYDAGVAGYFLEMFDYDFVNNCDPQEAELVTLPEVVTVPEYTVPGPAHPPVVGDVAVTAFLNPDRGYAFAMLVNNLASVRKSLHITIYQTTTTTITNKVKDIKLNFPEVDVSEVLSKTRVGFDGYTPNNTATLIASGVNVWNSNTTAYTLTHAKYWTWDGRFVTLYSGNWATTSFSGPTFSGTPNREWGLTFDSPCLYAAFDSVFQSDRAIGTPYSTLSDPRPYDACGVAGGPGINCPCSGTPTGEPTGAPTGTPTGTPNGIGLGQGETIGIAVGAAVAVILIGGALAAFFIIRKRRGSAHSLATQSKVELMSPPPPPIPAGRSLPAGWTEELDPQTNMPYYHDTHTGKTQWERPIHNVH